ncbi:coproporphyrinogen oxidase [Modicisalibacter ilicicola DSM 19980]|uniref:Curli production assembly/transport component CsgF n=1 Tax=Modicisalibacter ilicicola DSM 19980 TaxID=1121942 RepID=A0A1M4VTN3_9GAMM|nr:curli assembly protein CsgF [Halomonas ilicicola]SHE72386.1 coproporphyrinogen oxidase [Halomonas ilicicola DSM 19980]
MTLRYLLLPLALIAAGAQAGELIYQPINPSFGGDPLVGNYLLNKAQAQDDNEDPDARDFGDFSPNQFRIEDQVYESLDDAIEAAKNGETGSFSTIDSPDLRFQVESLGSGGYRLIITDRVTGEVTSINVGAASNNF